MQDTRLAAVVEATARRQFLSQDALVGASKPSTTRVTSVARKGLGAGSACIVGDAGTLPLRCWYGPTLLGLLAGPDYWPRAHCAPIGYAPHGLFHLSGRRLLSSKSHTISAILPVVQSGSSVGLRKLSAY